MSSKSQHKRRRSKQIELKFYKQFKAVHWSDGLTKVMMNGDLHSLAAQCTM